jgi:hypothetical protein
MPVILTGSRLLMFLNSTDLCVCISTILTHTLKAVSPKTALWIVIENITESLYAISVDAAGFATFLLSTIRCLCISVPMFSIRGSYVAIAAALFIGYTAIREITFWIMFMSNRSSYRETVHASFILSGIGLMVTSVALMNLISMKYIMMGTNVVERSREAGVHATVTVAILSGLFCLLNTFYLVSSVLHFYFGAKMSLFLLKFGIFFSVPFNSALNPLVYVLRNKDMRKYLIDLFKIPLKSYQPLSRQEMIPITND